MSAPITLGRTVQVRGVGLRTGTVREASLGPAESGEGFTFVVRGTPIRAEVGAVVDATLATTLGAGRSRIALVEHLLAAFVGAGIDAARIEIDGDELPILDGTSLGWLGAIARAGVRTLPGTARRWTVGEPVSVVQGESHAELLPAPALSLDISVDFAHPAIGRQRWCGEVGARFGVELAWARTFGFRRDAERLLALGIARGATLENTVVFDDAGPMNPGGQRAIDEVVRHKALDAVGDLALGPGRPDVLLRAVRGGHALHHALLREAARRGVIVATSEGAPPR